MCMHVYVGLCMPMQGYAWLCRVVYAYVGSYMPMHGYVWLCRVM